MLERIAVYNHSKIPFKLTLFLMLPHKAFQKSIDLKGIILMEDIQRFYIEIRRSHNDLIQRFIIKTIELAWRTFSRWTVGIHSNDDPSEATRHFSREQMCIA